MTAALIEVWSENDSDPQLYRRLAGCKTLDGAHRSAIRFARRGEHDAVLVVDVDPADRKMVLCVWEYRTGEEGPAHLYAS